MQKENSTDEAPVEINKPEYWQWIKGDLIGNVVTFKDTDDSYINFNEGGRITIDLRDEFLQKLDGDIAGEFIGTDSIETDPLNISGNLTRNDLPLQTDTLAKVITPIRVLFDKQKKNDKVKLILEFPVNIPPKGIYDLMSTSFDADEVKDELKDFILDQLSTDNITDCLNQSVESLIESKYKDE
jgi:hypothetical protein